METYMIAALKCLQFKQKDITNQTYMRGRTQKKEWVEVLKDKIQMYYVKVVQLGPSTQPLSLQHPPPSHTHFPKDRGWGRHFENCVTFRCWKPVLCWVTSATDSLKSIVRHCQGTGHLRERMLTTSKHCPGTYLQVLTDLPRSMA